MKIKKAIALVAVIAVTADVTRKILAYKEGKK